MSDDRGQDAVSERAQTSIVLAKFRRAAAALVCPPAMSGIHLAMLALLAEIDDELEGAGVSSLNLPSTGAHHA